MERSRIFFPSNSGVWLRNRPRARSASGILEMTHRSAMFPYSRSASADLSFTNSRHIKNNFNALWTTRCI